MELIFQKNIFYEYLKYEKEKDDIIKILES